MLKKSLRNTFYFVILLILAVISFSLPAACAEDENEPGHFVTRDGVVYWVTQTTAHTLSYLPDTVKIVVHPTVEGKPVSLNAGFENLPAVEEIVIEEGVKGISRLSFQQCSKLKNITLSTYTPLSEKDAFDWRLNIIDCPQLETYNIIGIFENYLSECFFSIAHCPSLIKFDFPPLNTLFLDVIDVPSIKVLNPSAIVPISGEYKSSLTDFYLNFSNTPSLLYFNVDPNGENVQVIDNVVFETDYCYEDLKPLTDKPFLHLDFYPPEKEDVLYSLPKNVESINEDAFYYNGYLKYVLLWNYDGASSLYSSGNDLHFITTQGHPSDINYKIIEENIYYTNHEEKLVLELYHPLQTESCFVVPKEVNFIDNQAFAYNESLKCVIVSTNTSYPPEIKDQLTVVEVEESKYTKDNIQDTISAFLVHQNQTASPLSSTTYIVKNSFHELSNLGVDRLGQIEVLVFSASINESFYAQNLHLFPSLQAINVAEENPNYQSIDGVLYSKDGTELIAFPPSHSTLYNVPMGTKKIGNLAFYQNQTLESITLPYTITDIGEGAFENAEHLQNISLPQSLTTIGSSAFSNCKSLQKVILPKGITSLNHHDFSLYAPGKKYSWQTFISRDENIYSCLEIWIPPSVQTIEGNPFDGRSDQELVLVVEEGSHAHDYALKNHLPYRFITDSPIKVKLKGAAVLPANQQQEAIIYADPQGNQPISKLPLGTVIDVMPNYTESLWQGFLEDSFFYIHCKDILFAHIDWVPYEIGEAIEEKATLSLHPFMLYASPWKEGTVLHEYPANTPVKIIYRHGPWYYVEIGNQKGYVFGEALSPGLSSDFTSSAMITGSKTLVTSLYSFPDQKAPVSANLFQGQVLTIIYTDETRTWCYVSSIGENNKTIYGYILLEASIPINDSPILR